VSHSITTNTVSIIYSECKQLWWNFQRTLHQLGRTVPEIANALLVYDTLTCLVKVQLYTVRCLHLSDQWHVNFQCSNRNVFSFYFKVSLSFKSWISCGRVFQALGPAFKYSVHRTSAALRTVPNDVYWLI